MKRISWHLPALLLASGALMACPHPSPGTDGGTKHVLPEDAGPPPPLPAVTTCDWTQWGNGVDHNGMYCGDGQVPMTILADIPYDQWVTQEMAEAGGELTGHYSTPLSSGDDVFMMFKSGNYPSCETPGQQGTYDDGGIELCGIYGWNQQTWHYKKFSWANNQLSEQWSFWSDWKPVPVDKAGYWEPAFQGTLAGDFIYVPGFGGTVHKLNKSDGMEVAQIKPLGSTIDPNTYVTGGLSADKDGNVYYNTTQYFGDENSGVQATGAWLVKVYPDGGSKTATYASLTPGAPAQDDLCYYYFYLANKDHNNGGYDRPWPPAPVGGQPVLPPQYACGMQRPGTNIIPAVAADGTIYTASKADYISNYGYVIAANPDLTPKWNTSMRGLVNDGCGVTVPQDVNDDGSLMDGGVWPDGGKQYWPYHCRISAAKGVDPVTNLAPAGPVDDEASSSPVVVPDGVLFGAVTTYNTARGHMFKFDTAGHYVGNFDFGWDITPAVFKHDGTYSIVTKDNHYYYYDSDKSDYGITRLNKDLVPEWTFKSTNHESCERDQSGTVTCIDDDKHKYGFEWCTNAPAVDNSGHVFVNSEDGWVYDINPDGTLHARQFLRMSIEAAYTPLAIDHRGRIMALNKGELMIVGQTNNK